MAARCPRAARPLACCTRATSPAASDPSAVAGLQNGQSPSRMEEEEVVVEEAEEAMVEEEEAGGGGEVEEEEEGAWSREGGGARPSRACVSGRRRRC